MSKYIGEKTPEWEVEDLLDGRFALKRYGIVQHVAQSEEELRVWFSKRFSVKMGTSQRDETLSNAIERLP